MQIIVKNKSNIINMFQIYIEKYIIISAYINNMIICKNIII